MDDISSSASAESYAARLLVGERIRLRPLAEADLPVLDRWWQQVEMMALQRRRTGQP